MCDPKLDIWSTWLLGKRFGGDPWSQNLTEVLVLVAMLVAGLLISSRLFRWE